MDCSIHLVSEKGVATVPGRGFYSKPEEAATKIRFAFCKKKETLLEAVKRLNVAG